jgi:(1->4)-alpha-D-glucan 1-alpha-D-glucosylmutase
LQFHRGFTLDDAVRLVPYFDRLGISHVYASPLLAARKGSPHGYDITGHDTINPELGGEPALRRLVAALRAAGMGLILDIVPNHMAVGADDNAWWLDVLEWGSRSRYARFFDIDWRSRDPELRGKVLAPFLGRPYSACLADGEITLRFDTGEGRLFAAYYHHRLPLAPSHYGPLLREQPPLQDLANAFDEAARSGPDRFSSARAALRERAASGAGKAALEGLLRPHDARDATGRACLHALIERQNWRLCWWRLAADRINWRRFFDINGLAALCVERPDVFETTHALILRLYAEGLIDGVRVDHIDGLVDPAGYCRRLRRRLDALAKHRGPAWIIVEKILAPGERLRTSWRVDGTTGYDFMSEVSALQHDPAGEPHLRKLWHELSGRSGDFEEEARAARREVLSASFAGELDAAVAAFCEVAGADLQWRDTPPGALRGALTAVLAHMPVYRLYGQPRADEQDRRMLAMALKGARRALPLAEHQALRLVAEVLAGHAATRPDPLRQKAARRFHQLSAPLAAKAVEDTAFYRYGRLLSRNEVGASPAQFAISPEAFHAACRERRRSFPAAMLATATHDHKRGEDLRARLAVLGEVPAEWEDAVRQWRKMNASLRRQTPGSEAPDPADEYMLYQMATGAWPLDLSPDDAAGVVAFAERLAAWQEKALREAKRRTSWQLPRHAYERACRDFVMQAPCDHAAFRMALHRFVERIAAAGALNGLVQTALRMTAPGVPDLYQGTELWDFSMVDPDNRRPVDFARRQQLLESYTTRDMTATDWRDGALKQHLIARTLDLRRRRPALFADGDYAPLKATGPAARHVIAFARLHKDETVVVLAARLPLGLAPNLDAPLVPPHLWADTAVALPGVLHSGRWANALNDAVLTAADLSVLLKDVLNALPVAILEPSRP